MIFYVAPIIFITFFAVMFTGFLLFYLKIIDIHAFVLLMFAAPFVGVGAVVFAIYMQQVSRKEDIIIRKRKTANAGMNTSN